MTQKEFQTCFSFKGIRQELNFILESFQRILSLFQYLKSYLDCSYLKNSLRIISGRG